MGRVGGWITNLFGKGAIDQRGASKDNFIICVWITKTESNKNYLYQNPGGFSVLYHPDCCLSDRAFYEGYQYFVSCY